MVIPTPTVMPDSTLAPSQIAAKFQSRSLGFLSGEDEDAALIAALREQVDNTDYTYYPEARPIVYMGGGAGSNGAGTDWGKIFGNLAASGIDLAKLAIVQPGTTQTQGGISRQNPGYPVLSGPGTGSPVADAAGGVSTALILAGVGLVAVMMLSKRQGG